MIASAHPKISVCAVLFYSRLTEVSQKMSEGSGWWKIRQYQKKMYKMYTVDLPLKYLTSIYLPFYNPSRLIALYSYGDVFNLFFIGIISAQSN